MHRLIRVTRGFFLYSANKIIYVRELVLKVNKQLQGDRFSGLLVFTQKEVLVRIVWICKNKKKEETYLGVSQSDVG